MMKRLLSLLTASALMFSLCGCGNNADQPEPKQTVRADAAQVKGETTVTKSATVGEVIANPALGDFDRLLFPVDRAVTEDMTLEQVSTSSVYVWYSHIFRQPFLPMPLPRMSHISWAGPFKKYLKSGINPKWKPSDNTNIVSTTTMIFWEVPDGKKERRENRQQKKSSIRSGCGKAQGQGD